MPRRPILLTPFARALACYLLASILRSICWLGNSSTSIFVSELGKKAWFDRQDLRAQWSLYWQGDGWWTWSSAFRNQTAVHNALQSWLNVEVITKSSSPASNAGRGSKPNPDEKSAWRSPEWLILLKHRHQPLEAKWHSIAMYSGFPLLLDSRVVLGSGDLWQYFVSKTQQDLSFRSEFYWASFSQK